MAIYHLHVSSGSKTSVKGAGGKVRYLLREGPYAVARERVQDGAVVRSVEIDKRAELVHAESGNLPAWAVADPARFWDASDAHERANGCIYREVEVALPEELSQEQQIALARAFADDVATVDGGVTPYTLAIHQQDAAHPEHRHVHILLSDRIMDGVERDAVTLFRQPSAKVPGARKTRERLPIPAHKDDDGKAVPASTWTDRVRPLWERLANEALERAGVDARIDRRTLDAQRIEQEQLAEQALAVGDAVGARRHQRQADALDRPPEPKKGRVLTHVGPEKAPERAAMVVDFEAAKAERQAVIETRRAAEQEAAEIEKRLAAAQELEKSHPAADTVDTQQGIAIAQAVAVHLVQQAEAHREQVRAAWSERQAAIAALREAAEIERQNRQLDAEAAAEQRAGIRHPDKPRWQQYRERVLTEAYNRDVGEALGRWVRVERVEHGLHIHNKQMDLTDHGDRITARGGGLKPEIDVMMQLARAKGWTRLDLTGSREFQERAGAAALAAGFDLVDAELKGSIREAQRKAEQEAAEIVRRMELRRGEIARQAAQAAQVAQVAQVAQERAERQRKLLDFAKAMWADPDARMDLGPAYRAAGYQLREEGDGKTVWTYPHDDLRDERKAVFEARQEWNKRREARDYLGDDPRWRQSYWNELVSRTQSAPVKQERPKDLAEALDGWIASRQERNLPTNRADAEAVVHRLEQYGWTSDSIHKDYQGRVDAQSRQISDLTQEGKRLFGGNRNAAEIARITKERAALVERANANIALAMDYEKFRPGFIAREFERHTETWRQEVALRDRIAPHAQAILAHDREVANRRQAEQVKRRKAPARKKDLGPDMDF